MNDTATTKKTEFVFRRLADSFDQFTGDLWGAVPLWLLAVVAVLLAAPRRLPVREPGQRRAWGQGPGAKALSAAVWVSAVALTVWVLVAYYNRDSEQTKGTTEAVSALVTGNVAKWYSFTIGLFVLGCVFVALMYVKDTKTVRWFWAVPLALLRVTVYAILCVVFLLPAVQTFEDTNKQSRVVILLDITPSVTAVTDETGTQSGKARDPHGHPHRVPDRREGRVPEELLEKNPVAIYAFGTRLDVEPQVIEQGVRGVVEGRVAGVRRLRLQAVRPPRAVRGGPASN